MLLLYPWLKSSRNNLVNGYSKEYPALNTNFQTLKQQFGGRPTLLVHKLRSVKSWFSKLVRKNLTGMHRTLSPGLIAQNQRPTLNNAECVQISARFQNLLKHLPRGVLAVMNDFDTHYMAKSITAVTFNHKLFCRLTRDTEVNVRWLIDQPACPSLWLTADPRCHAIWLSGCRRRHYLSPGRSLILGSIPDRRAFWFQLLEDCWLDCRGCYSHTRGSANPQAALQSVSDGGSSTAGLTEQQIEMNWTPGEESRRHTIRKMTMTLLQVTAVITEKGQWHPSASGVSMWQGRTAAPSPPPPPLRLCPWRCEVMTWQNWIYSLHIYCEVTLLTCRFQSTSQGGSTSSD